jgi:predicted ATPase/DNA-binding winged helix-turn-helix (wHTH) protein
MSGRAISFGPFRLLTGQRLLLEGDTPVRLGSRAFDILAALVERAGQVVGKEELIARAWPQTHVEEANLKIQVSALRRALGDGRDGHRFVVTVPGRGYNFVAPVTHVEAAQSAVSPVVAGAHNLPHPVTRMIGRESVVSTLASRLYRQRLVVVVGAGGIGKTTVALAVAERMISAFEHGVWLVDMAPLDDPRLVARTVAIVLRLEISAEDSLPGVVAALSDRRTLLLLDNCEHVIDGVAALATSALGAAPGVSILATSREPLGISGEHDYRLGPLESPPPSSGLTAAEALTFPAVQLFVERVTALVDDFALTDESAPFIAEICRRLDGLPLAIEFAAARVEILGIEGVASRLNDSLRLLGGGRRGVLPRHRTMRAVVDWSYELLREEERRFFRALGIFAGGFTVEAAAAAVAEDPCDAIDQLADLVAKSLVAADVSGSRPRFRLLETTRAFASEKLNESGEREPIARHHAEYYRDLLERAETEWKTRPTAEWLDDYRGEIDNLRAALDWAASSSGDPELSVALTVATIPLWLELSLVEECRSRVEQALGSVARDAINARAQMKLQAALSASLFFTKGATPEAGLASADALRLAEALSDIEYQLRALWELWVYRNNTGEYGAGLDVAQRFSSLSLDRDDAADLPMADRMIGTSYHYLGDQTNARRHIDRMMSADVDPQRRSPHLRFWFDQKVAGRVVMARILWLQGFPDQARHIMQRAIGDAEALADPGTLCYALSHGGCLLALWAGDLAAAARYVETLLDHSRRHGFGAWSEFASRLKGIVLIKSGDLDAGSPLLRAGLGEIDDPNAGLWFLTALGQMAEALGLAERVGEALAAVGRGIDRSQECWLAPELLRLKGELLLLQGSAETASEVEVLFRGALDGARQQETLFWELRAATSLARLLRERGRSTEALEVLRPAFTRFNEGFDTSDLALAKQLVDELMAS